MNKSLRSRMGNAVRRTSSVLTISRPGTPSRASSDTSSIKQLDTAPSTLAAPTPSPPQQSTVPSPIAESPAREAAALEASNEPVGPSPLAHGTSPAEAQESAAEATERPPVFKSSPGLWGFTDEPGEMPQAEKIAAPSSEQQEGNAKEVVMPEPDQPIPETHGEERTGSETVAPPQELSVMDGAGSYFDLPAPQTIVAPEPTKVSQESVSERDLGNEAQVVKGEDANSRVGAQERNMYSERAVEYQEREQAPPIVAMSSYPQESYSGEEVWGGVQANQSDAPFHAAVKAEVIPDMNVSNGDVSSIRMPTENPFVDPESSDAPLIMVSHADGVHMPNPHPSRQHQGPPRESYEEAHGAIVMPLPAMHEVIPSKSIRNIPSAYSLSSRGHVGRGTDETVPLLSRPGTPQRTSYLQSSSINQNHMNISPQSGNPSSSAWPAGVNSSSTPRLHSLGWIEYVLPDATFYYVHPTLRVTTDIDLRNMKKLEAVTVYFDRKDSAFAGSGGGGAPVGLELWLRDAASAKRDWVPVRCWVDHKKRAVTFDPLQDGDGDSGRVGNDDRLDMEYRYWSFMEAHPAHTSLPLNARMEAMDVLTWAWTDRLLPSHRPVPAPFTQEECQELMNMLRSFGDTPGDSGIQTVVHTRIVSRILLRVAHWRQLYFRPNKPLPQDASRNGLRAPERRLSFRRAMLDFVISFLCLGIPYMFFTRSQHQRVDEESGIRSAGPVLMIGACTCLVAAIVLSASVTFLSLPGLDNIARIVALVAILCATASMVSSVIALFTFKAEMERAVSTLGGEGLMNLSRRSVVMSLPLVFLTYSIIGFIAGIVLYSFRGVTVTNSDLAMHHFDDYTRWTVVGVLGGLAGMLTTSVLLLKR